MHCYARGLLLIYLCSQSTGDIQTEIILQWDRNLDKVIEF